MNENARNKERWSISGALLVYFGRGSRPDTVAVRVAMGRRSQSEGGEARGSKPHRGGRVVTFGGGVGGADHSESDASDDESEEGRNWSSEEDEEEDKAGQSDLESAGEDEESDEGEAGEGMTEEEKADAARRHANTKQWERKHFVQKIKGTNSTIYKTRLLPEMAFHTYESFVEFLKGDRFQKILAQCRKGMRTHDENERLKQKAQARRLRAEERRAKIKKERRLRRKERVASLPTEEVERRKNAFQAKKARRLARKEAAAKALG